MIKHPRIQVSFEAEQVVVPEWATVQRVRHPRLCGQRRIREDSPAFGCVFQC